jgi:hypothetical protein
MSDCSLVVLGKLLESLYKLGTCPRMILLPVNILFGAHPSMARLLAFDISSLVDADSSISYWDPWWQSDLVHQVAHIALVCALIGKVLPFDPGAWS